MTPLREKRSDELRAPLIVARENERGWIELCPEASTDGERMAQWTSVAKLRRLEVERIEAELAEIGTPNQPGAGFET